MNKFLALIVSSMLIAGPIGAQTVSPPVKVKGQQATGYQVNKPNIQVPNKQATNLGGLDVLLETGNKNILDNPSFENANSGWTLTAGTYVVDNSPIDGKANALITLSAQSFEFYQDSTLYASQFADGVQGIILAPVRTTNPNIYMCQRSAGSNQVFSDGTNISNCAKHSGSGKWETLELPIILGGTSNGVVFLSLTASTGAAVAVTGDVEIDDVELKAGKVTGTTTLDTAWESCGHVAGDFTSFGTVTNIATQCKREGSDYLIKGSFTSGTSTAVEARIVPKFKGQLLTTASSSIIPSVQLAGKGARDNTSNANNDYSILIQPSLGYFNIAINNVSGTSAIAAGLGNALLSSGDKFSFFARIPIAGWSSNSDFYSSQCGAKCVDTFSAKVSSTPAVSDLNISGWVTSAANSGTSSQIKTLTIPSGIFSIVPNCTCTVNSSATAADRSCKFDVNGSSATSLLFNTASNGAEANLGIIVSCQKQGADFVATRTIVGSFEALNYKYVDAAGNGGQAITANVTNITFTEITDSEGAWNGTQFTASITGLYSVTGMVQTSASGSRIIDGYINGTLYRSLGVNDANAVYPFSGIIPLTAGQVFSIRSSAAMTLSNVPARHWLTITRVSGQ